MHTPPRPVRSAAAPLAALCLLLLGACAGTPAAAGRPDDGAQAAAVTYISAVGDTVWFHVADTHVRTFGALSREPPYTTEVHKTLAATLDARTGGASDYRVRVARVWGFVEDGNGRLEFDTDGVVPQVYCRLDDVQPEIQLAGKEAVLRVQADGKCRPADPASVRSMLDLLTFGAAAAIVGDDLRLSGALAAGQSWESSESLPFGGRGLSARSKTTVLAVDRETVDLEQVGGVGATPGPASGDGAAGRGSMSGRTKTTLRASRRDSLLLRSESEYESVARFGGGDAEMRHSVRTRLERTGRP